MNSFTVNSVEDIERALATKCWWCKGSTVEYYSYAKSYGRYLPDLYRWCTTCGGSGMHATIIPNRQYHEKSVHEDAPYLTQSYDEMV